MFPGLANRQKTTDVIADGRRGFNVVTNDVIGIVFFSPTNVYFLSHSGRYYRRRCSYAYCLASRSAREVSRRSHPSKSFVLR